MDNQIYKNQLIKEINLIPENKHQELYDLIHEFRISLNQSKDSINKDAMPRVKHRTPAAAIAGKAKILGDLVSPVVDEQDWECLK